jgi:signal transduction histidine kinase
MGTVDIKTVITAVIEDLNARAIERKITFNVKVPVITVRGSMEKLSILFSNLISNAINYSNVGGKVEVLSTKTPEHVAVSITDHGIGIREDALPHIFDEYYRTKEASKFNKMSTGLGLSMVKEITRNLGWGVRVTSTQGEGTTFEVFIPFTKKD